MAGEGEWESVKLKFDSQDLMGSTPNLYRSDRTKSKRTAGSVLGSSSSSLSSALERSSLEDVGRWEVDSNELELGRELGKGAFGTVFKGKLRGKEVAIKKLNVPDFDEDALLDFKQEVEILSKLRHPNVVLFMGTCLKPGNYMMVTEFMPKGSLFDILRSETDLPLKRRMKMAKDAALGMNWLHQSKPIFVHRDLKTQNLLVDENWTVKVADFGLSYIKKGSSSSGSFGAIGTPLWMAPEVLQNREYDEKCDVYSFGIVLWELLTNKTPFEEITTYAAMVDAVAVQHRRPPIPEDCPDRLKQLITACWHPEPANRPSFAEIIPMFDEIIVDSLINDENGRKMWKKYFMKDKLREVVSWKNFVIALTNLFKTRAPKETDDTRWKCLKAIVCDDTDKVNIEQFGRILEWFGPMEGLNVLEDVEDLLKRDWFHGDVSSEDAEKKLAKERKGTYLVRFSSRDPGCFAISVVSQGGRLKHYRIYHKPGLKYLIGKSECDSLDQIIVKYHKELYLKYPCEGSPFQEIFEEKKTAISAGYLVPDFE